MMHIPCRNTACIRNVRLNQNTLLYKRYFNCTNNIQEKRFQNFTNSNHLQNSRGAPNMISRTFCSPLPRNGREQCQSQNANPEVCFVDNYGTPTGADCGQIIFCKYASSTLINPQINHGDNLRMKADTAYPMTNNNVPICCNHNMIRQPNNACNNNNLSVIDEEVESQECYCTCAKKSDKIDPIVEACFNSFKTKVVKKACPCCRTCKSNIIKSPKRRNLQVLPVSQKQESYQCIMVKNKSLQCNLIKPTRAIAKEKQIKAFAKPFAALECLPTSPPVKIICNKSFKKKKKTPDTSSKVTSISITCVPRDLQEIPLDCTPPTVKTVSCGNSNTQTRSKYWFLSPFRKMSSCKSKVGVHKSENKKNIVTLHNPCYMGSAGKNKCGTEIKYTVLIDPLSEHPTPSQESLFQKCKTLIDRISLHMTLK